MSKMEGVAVKYFKFSQHCVPLKTLIETMNFRVTQI